MKSPKPKYKTGQRVTFPYRDGSGREESVVESHAINEEGRVCYFLKYLIYPYQEEELEAAK